jgi:hypothetical protein
MEAKITELRQLKQQRAELDEKIKALTVEVKADMKDFLKGGKQQWRRQSFSLSVANATWASKLKLTMNMMTSRVPNAESSAPRLYQQKPPRWTANKTSPGQDRVLLHRSLGFRRRSLTKENIMTARISWGLTILSQEDRERLVREAREKIARRYGDHYRGRPVEIYTDFDGEGIAIYKNPDESLDIACYQDPVNEWYPI